MKRLAFLFFLFAISALAQTPTGTFNPQVITFRGVPSGVCDNYQQALDVNTGLFYSCNPSTRSWVTASMPKSYTVATLPVASTVQPGTVVAVTDAVTPGSCTTGGGVGLALCRSNGVSWQPIGDGGGNAGGGSPPLSLNSPNSGTCTPFAGQDSIQIGTATGPQMSINGGPCIPLLGAGPSFNVLAYGAKPDGSTDSSTAITSAFTVSNAVTSGIPTVYFPCELGSQCEYVYSGSGISPINPLIPTTIKCDPGVDLHYTGSAHAEDWGPTTLTGSTYQTVYIEQGCRHSGGSSMTQGIYVNDGILYPRIWDDQFLNFGNSTAGVWQIFFNGNSIGIDDPEVARSWFFSNDNVGRNGVKVNSANGNTSNQLRFTDNVALCAQVPGVTNANGTHSCSHAATFLFSDGVASIISNNNIAWFQPDIQIGSNSLGTVIEGNTFEANSSSASVSAPVISFGDSTGGNCVACAIDGIRIAYNHANLHNSDNSTTSSFLGPSTTSSLIENIELLFDDFTQKASMTPAVAMNNTSGQFGNVYENVLTSSTGAIPYAPDSNIQSTGSNLNNPFIGLTSEGNAAGVTTYGISCSNTTLSGQGCYARLQQHSATSSPFSRLVLDTGGDSQSYPNRGGFVQHTSGGATKIGDWEGLPVQILTSPTAGSLGLDITFLPQGGIEDQQTTFSASGCSISAHKGGAAFGQYTSGTTGTCTVTITPGSTAANGWTCWANDLTNVADLQHQTAASSVTQAVISGTTASGDVVNFGCTAY